MNRNLTKNKLLWGLALLVGLQACISTKDFPVEVFKPAKISVLPDMRNLVLVSRNLKFKEDTLKNYFQADYRLRKDMQLHNNDSIAVSAFLNSAEAQLKMAQRFDTVRVLPYDRFRPATVTRVMPMSDETVRSIREQTQCDGIISLDLLSYFYSKFSPNGETGSRADVIMTGIWSFYDAKKEQLLARQTIIDTLYWDNMVGKIPPKPEAIALAASVCGENFSKNFVPGWEKVYRSMVLNKHDDFIKAARLAQNSEWDKAQQLWEVHKNDPNMAIRFAAFYNLALCNEMQGNIDEALENITKAMAATKLGTAKELAKNYHVILYIRMLEIKKLDQEMKQE